ncbi:hypothetical protein O3M35_011560 [Rhynocoris fuscipes]|uniref:RING-type domain-containing protein n=1 Tax=Rhynocoris fuscipes TaxID=488301 RepID=A0AAW1CYK3_9HEMI
MSDKSEEKQETQVRDAIVNLESETLIGTNVDDKSKNENLQVNKENENQMNVLQFDNETMILVEVQGAIAGVPRRGRLRMRNMRRRQRMCVPNVFYIDSDNVITVNTGGRNRGRFRARNIRQRNPDRSRSNLRTATERESDNTGDRQELCDYLDYLEENTQTKNTSCPRDTSTENVMLSAAPLELNTLATPNAEETEEAEVEDLIYEEITLDTISNRRPTKSWRSVPKYKLSRVDAIQQEADLFHCFINEKNHEDTIPAGEDESRCCVCRENKATRVVIPCGHKCLCHHCSRRIALMKTTNYFGHIIPKRCPLCRAIIAQMIFPKVVEF